VKSRSSKANDGSVDLNYVSIKYKLGSQNKPLKEYTVVELKRIAKNLGLTGYNLKRPELINIIGKYLSKDTKQSSSGSSSGSSSRSSSRSSSPTGSVADSDSDSDAGSNLSDIEEPKEPPGPPPTISPTQPDFGGKSQNTGLSSGPVEHIRAQIPIDSTVGPMIVTASRDTADELETQLTEAEPIDIVQLLREIQEEAPQDIVQQEQTKQSILKCLALDTTGGGRHKFAFDGNEDGDEDSDEDGDELLEEEEDDEDEGLIS